MSLGRAAGGVVVLAGGSMSLGGAAGGVVVLAGDSVSMRSPTLAGPAGFDGQDERSLPAGPSTGVKALHSSDLLLLLALALWLFGLSQVNIARPGPYGLPSELPVAFYAGIGVLLISATCELIRARPSPWRLAVHAVALVFMLYGTAPLLYQEGRYGWLYKTTGVVQYINAHGSLDRHIDIYQNWPGFFALAGWFDKVAGVGSPLAYAKWAQVVFELAALPLLYLIYSTLSLSIRQRWTAILLFSASNWIGQDYFSPQALSTVVSLGLMAVVMRWLYIGAHGSLHAGGPSAIRQRSGIDMLISLAAKHKDWRWSPMAAAVLMIVILFTYLTFTHQLSPYMVVVQLAALAAFRLVRPRWIPGVLAAIAVVYLIPRYSFVASHYGLTHSIGRLFSNIKPPSASAPNISPAQHFIQRCAEALSIGIWLLAAFSAWRYRGSGRSVRAMALLAYSPVAVLAMGAYGNEGILRVYLFSLPWSAALAALILAPSRAYVPAPLSPRAAAIVRRLRRAAWSAADALRVPARWMKPGVLRIPVTLGIAIVLFFPAFFGDDAFNYMTKAEVDVTASYWLKAHPGHVFLGIDAGPVADTWRYNLFPPSFIFGGTLYQSSQPDYNIASLLAKQVAHNHWRRQPAYIMVDTNMIEYNKAYGISIPHAFYILLNSLQRPHSPWKLVLNRAGVLIYKLPARPRNGITKVP